MLRKEASTDSGFYRELSVPRGPVQRGRERVMRVNEGGTEG